MFKFLEHQHYMKWLGARLIEAKIFWTTSLNKGNLTP
jgi:hypothetical protein